jgi:hypothetical protein
MNHHADKLIYSAIGMSTVTHFIPSIPFVVTILMAAMLITGLISFKAHGRSICDHCADTLPIDPKAYTEKYHWRFYIAHIFEDKRMIIGYYAILMLSGLLTAFFLGQVLWVLVQFTICYLILSGSTHQKFQPWCQYCDNGGDEIREPLVQVGH